jgi:two pore calcium channel protein
MFILFTTANFPDVMLPAYYQNRWAAMYFVFFLLVSIYFLTNILLATVFDNYKARTKDKLLERAMAREKAIETIYRNCDADNNGTLDEDEVKVFWCLTLQLYPEHSKTDARQYTHVLSLVDPDNTKLVRKATVYKLLNQPNFFDII